MPFSTALVSLLNSLNNTRDKKKSCEIAKNTSDVIKVLLIIKTGRLNNLALTRITLQSLLLAKRFKANDFAHARYKTSQNKIAYLDLPWVDIIMHASFIQHCFKPEASTDTLGLFTYLLDKDGCETTYAVRHLGV